MRTLQAKKATANSVFLVEDGYLLKIASCTQNVGYYDAAGGICTAQKIAQALERIDPSGHYVWTDERGFLLGAG